MTKRVTLVTAIVACVFLAALAIGVVACGSGSAATTTTAAPTTTSAAPTTTTAALATTTSAAGTATTAAGSVTIPSIQMTPEVQAYIQKMQQWALALNSISSTDDPLKITDASAATAAQITAAEAVSAQAHAALDQLKAITAPAALAALQQSLVTLISGAVDATDKAIDALKKKDPAAFAAAKAQADQLETQMNGLFESLAPLLMGGTATS
jgi:hypothetical protein